MASPHVKRKLKHENIESHPCNGASAPTYGQQG